MTLPDELVAAMGISAATLVGAKIITTTQVASGRISKSRGSPGNMAALVADDQNNADLTKVQMLGWTLVAATIYIVRVIALVRNLPVGDVFLPAIDPSLIVLCGIGHAAYLGQKVASAERPRLTGLSPASGHGPLPVTINGSGMGEKEGATLLLDGAPVATFVSSWSEDRIDVTFPPTRPDGTPWPKDRPISVGLVTGGRSSANTLFFTFA